MKCEKCERTVSDNRWSRIHAHEEGWFDTKDGHVWCPEHVPDWVAEWREKRGAK